MYELDLRHPREQKPFDLGDNFSGTSPDGHRIHFTSTSMMMDGRPFFGISGEMHFSRVTPDQWEDSLVKMRCGGINMLSTYVFWNVHEEEEGVFRFDGARDLRHFLELCEKHHMPVIIRIGPYAHGEMRNGGLPDWLYGKPFEVRENNPGFLACVRSLFRALHSQMDGHYFSQGGCIIAAQVENEYQHSSSPWEHTRGISDEWVSAGHSGIDYMLALKRIMQEEGIRTPFYTATAWGGAVVPQDEMLPMWGGYSYQPWLFYRDSGVHPATPEYIYRDNHSSLVPREYNFEPTYDPETRPYALCELMGGMMCSYRYRFRLDPRAVDALANIKLGSGCSMLGYYMYRGGTNPTGLRTPYLNEGQVPKRSYDYQAAIGEFGQIRTSYGRLKALHLFCRTFSDLLSETRAVLPEHLASLQPSDPGPLRFSVRVKGSSGFLFVNNFQDHAPMQARQGDTVCLHLPGGDTVLRFDIAQGENAVLPFGLRLGDAFLNWATAQPMACLGNTWFFLVPDGMTPRYCVNGHEIESRPGEAFSEGGQVFMTLSRRDAEAFWLCENTAFLCRAPLLADGAQLKAEISGTPEEIYRWSENQQAFLPFTHLSPVCESRSVSWQTAGSGRYVMKAPADLLKGHKQVLLRVRYRGDIGSAFIGGTLISDNFSNGDAWDIRLDDHAEELKDQKLVLLLTPFRHSVTVDASAMAGLKEHADTEEGELCSAELIFFDDILIPNAFS